MADETIHPRPDQAEEPVEDVGASNVDLDEARHGPGHVSPAAPEEGHAPDDHVDGHGDHDAGHDDHGDHPVEDPKWVLAPLVVGAVVGLVVAVVLGLQAGALPT
ncbi:MAG TPA: hypothetical protein VEW93_11895 [Acidimicrobiales bacterium]|nr:hypothetical protein [Acidimicrobiales bacterium]